MATVSPENPWSYSLTLPHDPRSARIARITLRGVMESHGMDELADVTELVVSELVTNAYLYSDGPAEIRLRQVHEDNIRISIWDTNPDIPTAFERRHTRPGTHNVPEIDLEAACGRGLLIVRLCAEAWGSWSVDKAFPGLAGKMLWCELSTKSSVLGIAA